MLQAEIAADFYVANTKSKAYNEMVNLFFRKHL